MPKQAKQSLQIGDIVRFKKFKNEYGVIKTEPNVSKENKMFFNCNVLWFKENKTEFVFIDEIEKVS